jgi:hypothetical protein
MRRLLRILLNIATALSLVLFLAIVVAWWRGRTRYECVLLFRESQDDRGLRQTLWTIGSSGGDLSVSVDRRTTDAEHARTAGCRPGVRSRMDAYSWWDYHRNLRELRDPSGWPEWVWDGVVVVLARDEGPGGYLSLAGSQLRGDVRTYCAVVQCWLLALAAAAGPSWRATTYLRRRRAARRTRAGLCPACGYDLRATPDRCPECGRVPEVARHANPRSTPAEGAGDAQPARLAVRRGAGD